MEECYPVELTAPDIAPYRAGNTGVDYATSFDSGLPGPHVMISAVTHGNEICGAITLDFLFRQEIRPTRGRLTLAFNNVRAYHAFDPAHPTLSRFVDEDFNRLWASEILDGPRASAELARARELRPLVETVDYLLDIHSMQTSIAPLMLAGPLAKGCDFARRLGYPAHVVMDAGHAAGPRLRDYGAFADPASPRNALLIEAGQHWETATAEVSTETALRFLLALDIVDRDIAAAHIGPEPAPQKVIEVTRAVTIRTGQFRFAEAYSGLEVIPARGTLLATDGDEAVTTPYDDCVLIMPSRRLFPGQTAVRLGRIVG